jgi:hypothetical protein
MGAGGDVRNAEQHVAMDAIPASDPNGDRVTVTAVESQEGDDRDWFRHRPRDLRHSVIGVRGCAPTAWRAASPIPGTRRSRPPGGRIVR